MFKTLFVCLALAVITLPVLPALAVEVDSGLKPAAPAKAGIDSLPPVGTGHDMVKPYQQSVPIPVTTSPDNRGVSSGDRVRTPYSREIVPRSYRYGTPGYKPDGRGGRGYDFGYPGYREQGGGGYPHHRGSGNRAVWGR